jgi:hypothetical protein
LLPAGGYQSSGRLSNHAHALGAACPGLRWDAR